jgi:hypothetical protein
LSAQSPALEQKFQTVTKRNLRKQIVTFPRRTTASEPPRLSRRLHTLMSNEVSLAIPFADIFNFARTETR